MAEPTVAILGTGRMGSAMAERLAGGGFALVLYNRTPERADALAERIRASVAANAIRASTPADLASVPGGAASTPADLASVPVEVAATPAEAASRADVIISMVADDDAVAALYAGPEGVIAGIRPGAVAVDMSTVLPDTIRSLAPAVRARGAGVLDAPVSGSVSSARSGELTIMVGGEPGDLDRGRPVLERLARRVFHLGPLGTGAAMKLAVNTVIFGLNGAVSEGLVLAERNGIGRALAYDVLAASAAGAPMVAYKRDAFLDPKETPVAFSLALAAKDLGLIRRLADASGTAMPQAAVNLELIEQAERSIGAEADFSAVARHLRDEGRR